MDKAIHSVQLGGMGISHFHPAYKRLIVSVVRGSCSQVSYRLASYVPKNAWLQSSLLSCSQSYLCGVSGLQLAT